jgi:lysylphosphatidylglycerol synthetase-like protein (DUF2156 family)
MTWLIVVWCVVMAAWIVGVIASADHPANAHTTPIGAHAKRAQPPAPASE